MTTNAASPARHRRRPPLRRTTGTSRPGINQRYTDVIRAWESRIVEYVGRRDDQTLLLARELDRLQRRGYDAEHLLDRAAARKRLPDDHATAALAYRVREQVSPRPRRAATPSQPHRSLPPRQSPGIGF